MAPNENSFANKAWNLSSIITLLSLLGWMFFVGITEVNKKMDKTDFYIAEQKLIKRDADLKTEMMDQMRLTNEQIRCIQQTQLEQIALLNKIIGMHQK